MKRVCWFCREKKNTRIYKLKDVCGSIKERISHEKKVRPYHPDNPKTEVRLCLDCVKKYGRGR